MFVFQGDSKYVDKARKLLLTTEAPTNDCSRVQASDISKSADSVPGTHSHNSLLKCLLMIESKSVILAKVLVMWNPQLLKCLLECKPAKMLLL